VPPEAAGEIRDLRSGVGRELTGQLGDPLVGVVLLDADPLHQPRQLGDRLGGICRDLLGELDELLGGIGGDALHEVGDATGELAVLVDDQLTELDELGGGVGGDRLGQQHGELVVPTVDDLDHLAEAPQHLLRRVGRDLGRKLGAGLLVLLRDPLGEGADERRHVGREQLHRLLDLVAGLLVEAREVAAQPAREVVLGGEALLERRGPIGLCFGQLAQDRLHREGLVLHRGQRRPQVALAALRQRRGRPRGSQDRRRLRRGGLGWHGP
jgi:hypothetical protein